MVHSVCGSMVTAHACLVYYTFFCECAACESLCSTLGRWAVDQSVELVVMDTRSRAQREAEAVRESTGSTVSHLRSPGYARLFVNQEAP